MKRTNSRQNHSMTKGLTLYWLKRYDEALPCFDRVLALDAKHVEAWYWKGRALDFLGRHEEMLMCYDRALALDAKHVEAWYLKGLALCRLARYDEGLLCFDRVLVLDAKHVDAWDWKGRALYRLARYDEGLLCFDRALALDAKHVETWYFKGLALYFLGGYDEALSCFDHALAMDAKHVKAWYWKGRALDFLGGYDEALPCFDHALTLDAKHVEAWYWKGQALYRLVRYDEALSCFDRVLALDAQHVEARYFKGLALYCLKRYDKALSCFDRVLVLDAKHVGAWHWKGCALYFIGGYDEALSCFDHSLARDAQHVEAWYFKGLALYCLKRYDEALPCFDRVLALDAKHVEAWYFKGLALYCLKRYDKALSCSDRVLALDAKHVETWYFKGWVLYFLDRYDEALPCFDRVLVLDDKHVDAWNGKGLILLGLKRLDKATLFCFDKAISENKFSKNYPNPETFSINRTYCVLMQGKVLEAKTTFDGLLLDAAVLSNVSSQVFIWQGLALIAAHQNDKELLRELKTKIAAYRPELDSSEEKILAFLTTHTEGRLRELKEKEAASPSANPMKKLSSQPGLLENYCIDAKHIRLGERIGGGQFGDVFCGEYHGDRVAIKRLKMDTFSEKVKMDFQKEVTMMVTLYSPRIIKFYGTYEYNGHHLVMEHMEQGSLHQVLSDDSIPLPWQPMRYQIALDIAMGLEFLHGREIIHRDLKSPNVLLDNHYRAKLADFGLAQIKTETKTLSSRREQTPTNSSGKPPAHTQSSVGTLRWMAPELFILRPAYGMPSDMFAFAIVLWELATRQVPFSEADDLEIRKSIKKGNYTIELANELRELHENTCPPAIIELMQHCWKQNPKERHSATAAVAHLKQIGFFAVQADVAPPSPHPNPVAGRNPPAIATVDGNGLNRADDRVNSTILGVKKNPK